MLNNRADAEDILQESFIDAFGQLRKFKQESTFGAWLKQIVVYKCINFLKRRKGLIQDLESIHDPADEIYYEEETVLTVERIKIAISEMATGYRTVLTLHLFEGYKQEEIAEMLGLSHSTVRTQYMRAKQKLLTILKERTVHG